MREIKFRAWDANGTFNNGVPCMHEDVTGTTMFDYIWHSDDFPKMQCTGLTDRNGKEIYEGDVVKGKTDIFQRLVGQVTYAGARYVIDGVKKYTRVREELESTYEVIGNIYENPELI